MVWPSTLKTSLMRFNNKTAIVTGAGQGIGFAICRQLVKEGATVILNDLDPALAENAASQIQRDLKGRCIAVAGDASEQECIAVMMKEVIKVSGQLDIAVANAGITLFGDFFTYTPDAFYKVMRVNLGGTFFLAQAAANQMKQQGKGGSILFTSSVTAHQAHKNLAAYGMSKAALEMLAKNLVIEVSGHNINVNTIAPGATLTERTLDDEDYHATWSKITPMGKPASVADIAHAALFLVQDESRHITGQNIIIDGGWTSISPSPYE